MYSAKKINDFCDVDKMFNTFVCELEQKIDKAIKKSQPGHISRAFTARDMIDFAAGITKQDESEILTALQEWIENNINFIN